MKFEAACKMAMGYFKEKYNDTGLASIKDLGDKWLFDGDNAEHVVIYGKHGITIEKNSGKQETFYLPNEKNFSLIDRAIELDVPEMYKVNA